MHVKHIQENADTSQRPAVLLDHRHVGDLAVGGRNDGPLHRRNRTLGIAKEPKEKRGQQQRNDGQGGQSQPSHQHGHRDKGQSVIDPVANHGLL